MFSMFCIVLLSFVPFTSILLQQSFHTLLISFYWRMGQVIYGSSWKLLLILLLGNVYNKVALYWVAGTVLKLHKLFGKPCYLDTRILYLFFKFFILHVYVSYI
jgi:hypothetical protein